MPIRPVVLTSWTDEGVSSPSTRVTEDITLAKGIHIRELRNAIDAEMVARGGSGFPWTTDPAITDDQITVKALHITELRSNWSTTRSTDCATDTTPLPTWTDDPLTEDQNLVKATHLNELREFTNNLESVSCLCDCNYTCGNNYTCGCNYSGCNDH